MRHVTISVKHSRACVSWELYWICKHSVYMHHYIMMRKTLGVMRWCVQHTPELYVYVACKYILGVLLYPPHHIYSGGMILFLLYICTLQFARVVCRINIDIDFWLTVFYMRAIRLLFRTDCAIKCVWRLNLIGLQFMSMFRTKEMKIYKLSPAMSNWMFFCK